MKFQLGRDAGLTVHIHDEQRCNFGIGEAIAGLGAAAGGGDLLGSLGALFGIGGADAAGAAAGVGAADAAAAGGLGDIVGTGAGLAGGTTGLTGTLLAGGVPAADIASGAALGTAGLGAAGTAADFLAAPSASAFNPAALSTGFGDELPTNATLTSGASSVFGPTTSATPGVASVGPPTTAPISNVSGTAIAAPTATSAPVGAAPTDLTSGFGGAASGTDGTVPGASGATSINGNPVSGGSGNILDNAVASITKNPLSLVGPVAGLGGLAYSVTQANKQLPEQAALTSAAETATAQGNQLSSYLLNGTLPAGLQTTLDKATADAKTAAISNAAKNGQSTDPTQNTTLAAELASIDQQATISTAQIGQSLLTSGLSETQLASQDYTTLLSADQTEQNLISQSISNFAKSLGGLGTSGIRLNVGTST